MRLLFVSHSADLLGAEQSLLDIATEAVANGHTVLVSVPRAGPLVQRLIQVGAAVSICPTYSWTGRRHNRAVGLLRTSQAGLAVRHHRALQRRFGADWVITNTASVPSGAWAARRGGVPHAWLIRESLQTNPNLKSVISKQRIARSIARNSAVLCAISDFVESQMCALEPRILQRHVGRLWPVRAPTSGASTPPGSSKVHFRTDSKAVRLLLLGSISEEKGQFLAVDAVASARNDGCQIELLIVGKGHPKTLSRLRDQIRATATDEIVRLAGWTDSVSELVRSADALLMPSQNEAFGRTTAEALVCGLPVVGFDAGATGELVAGGAGILTSHVTSAGLALAVKQFVRLSAQERNEMRNHAREAGERLSRQPSQYQTLISAIRVHLESVVPQDVEVDRHV
jgi:glycosyltransferase involved in cell wall biosynthesis